MDLGLAGAAVVVSGGSKGMGRAAAESIAAEGARVAVLARRPEALDETVAALRERGSPDAIGIRADLTQTDEVDAAFAELARPLGPAARARQRGRAGRGRHQADFESPRRRRVGRDVRHRHAERGALRARRAPALRRAEWARIVNISAHSTRRQSPSLVAYTASKAALDEREQEPRAVARTRRDPRQHGVARLVPVRRHARRTSPRSRRERGVDPDSLTDAMRVIAEDFGHPGVPAPGRCTPTRSAR